MLADKIRSRCQEMGMTVADLSKSAGVPYETLRRWGTGRLKIPNALDLVRVAIVLKVRTEVLLADELKGNTRE